MDQLARDGLPQSHPTLRVVHDWTTGRFFLEDEREAQPATNRSSAVASAMGSRGKFPWEQVIMPAQSTSSFLDPSPNSPPSNDASNPVDPSAVQNSQTGTRNKADSVTDAEVAALMLAVNVDGKASNAITWNGEPLCVKVAASSVTQTTFSAKHGRDRFDIDPQVIVPATDDTPCLTNVYELQQLMRIRPKADGFRDRNVNIGCQFTPMDRWSPDSEEEKPVVAEADPSSDEDDLPIFYRGDCVLFRITKTSREQKGRVQCRLEHSVFYDVKGSDGHIAKSIFAGNMRLRPVRKPKKPTTPTYHFAKHDKVLWLPSKSAEADEQHDSQDTITYKARVLQVRSLNRFDLLLRTGRVVSKVPYAELRPRTYTS